MNETLSHEFSVICCSWNNLELLKKFIPNLKKTCKTDYRIFVALNESKDESPEYLRSEGVQFVTLNENFGTMSVDMLLPFLKSKYVCNVNDDSLFYKGWDLECIKLIEEYYPAAAQIRGVEKRAQTCNVVVGDESLPNWLDDSAESVFWENCKNGKYKRDLQYALWHPICVRTEDHFKVGGYSDNWDENWKYGHSLDTNYAIRLWYLNKDYKFLLSGDNWYYHFSSYTNKKVKAADPQKDNKHNMDYLLKKTGMDHRTFHSLINYGKKVI